MSSATAANATTSAPDQRPPRSAAEMIDPRALMRIKSLELRAKVVVEGLFNGLHRSPYHGFSVEFTEYRQYTCGDDPRYLDWRLYARSDRYYIKRFEDETNLRCHLLVDLSHSMDYGSLTYNKAEYARTLAATLAYFLNTQRDAVGLVTFAGAVTDYLPARYRPGHLRRLMLSLERPATGDATRLEIPLEQIARTVTRRGLIVLISDMLAPLDTLELNLGCLRSQGHEVALLRVLDPAELDFAFDQPALFRDPESGRELFVDPAAVRREYLRRFEEHQQAVEKACAKFGIQCLTFRTDRSLELALFDFLRARMRRGERNVRRRASQAGGRA